MKVCTDSCILGAWTASRLGYAKNMLDIGSGTGLLPLMLSQKNEIPIDTIELDPESAAQARENIQQSPWAGQIQVLEGDARNFSFHTQYDFIITNPPFYESDLHSPLEKKNKAKHDKSLTLEQLMDIVDKNLRQDGNFSILLPFHRTAYFDDLAAAHGFSPRERLVIRQTPAHTPFRSIGRFSRQTPSEVPAEELIIQDEKRKNSQAFGKLMGDYY